MREKDTARSTLPLRITAHTCTGLPSVVVYPSLLECAIVIPISSEAVETFKNLVFHAQVAGKDHMK